MSAIAVFQLIQAVLASAPQSIEAIRACREFIQAMFVAKLIDKSTQDALMQWMDAHQALAALGIVPHGWEVRPDPVDLAG